MKENVQTFFDTHKKRISPLLFLGGFVFDLFTLTQVDLLYDNLVLLTHLLIISLSIFLIHLGKHDRVYPNWIERLMLIAPFTLVFSFGGVLSGYVIFYTKSASMLASWPFLLGLYLLFIGSEYIFNKFQQTVFQVSMWFAATLSFFIFFVPIMLRSIGPWIFILSNVISIVVGWLFVKGLIRAYKPLQKQFAFIQALFLLISAGFMVLYFTNIIPPIPLSLKEISVHHSIARNTQNQLIAQTENYTLLEKLNPIKTVTKRSGEPVFAFNAIYAPHGINTSVRHVWQYQNNQDEWVDFNTVVFNVVGGRTEGFRWYSFATPGEGRWRVISETTQGQELGRIVFNVINTDTPPALISQEL